MKPRPKITFFALCVFIIGILSGCVRVGDPAEETHSYPLDNLKEASVSLFMGTGELHVQSGTSDLLEGIFNYNVEQWKPQIDFRTSHDRGIITVRQGSAKGIPIGSGKNSWDIYLTEKIPLDLEVEFGAGEGTLDLRETWIETLQIEMGVGELTVDISGRYTHGFDVSIEGGVGSATVYLPDHVGVRVSAEKGIGSIEASGFKKRGDIYTNQAYGSSDITIDVDIEAGIGSIKLRLK